MRMNSCRYLNIREMDRLRTYKILKVKFGTESYLFKMKNRVLRTLFTKFRGGLLKLEGNVGRYTSIPFQDRLCPLWAYTSYSGSLKPKYYLEYRTIYSMCS